MAYYLISDDQSVTSWENHQKIQRMTPLDFFQKDEKFYKDVQGIIIPCALVQNELGQKVERHLMYGFDVARNLRLQHQHTYPILFVSFVSMQMLHSYNPFSVLAKAIGHDIFQLPCSYESAWKKLTSLSHLSPIELRDVQLFSCKPEGIINAEIHHLHQIIDRVQKGSDYQWVHTSLENSLKTLFSIAQKDSTGAISAFENNFPKLHSENIKAACDYIKVQGEKLIQELRNPNVQNNPNATHNRPWKLLLLDDELNENSTLCKLLIEKGVNIIFKTHADAAMHALNTDPEQRGKISLILCDYRLLEERKEGVFQQSKQGYTFLHEVGERFQSKMISAIVYSGMPRQFLLETFKSYKIRTETFSKADFGLDNVSALEFLCSRIIETGDENYEAMNALPLNNAGWEKHLQAWYIHYRNLSDYERREKEISDYCNKWIDDKNSGKDPQTPLTKGSKIGELHKYSKRCPQCNQVVLTENIKETENDKNLHHFTNILKARRIAQYQYLRYMEVMPEKDTLISIHKQIKPQKFGESEESRKQLSFTLGLKLSEFPLGATIEELNWLHFDREISVLDSYQAFKRRMKSTEELCMNFILEHPPLQDIIRNAKQIIQYSDKASQTDKAKASTSETYNISFHATHFSPYLFDKKDVAIFIKWLSKSVQQTNDEKMMDAFLSAFCDNLKKIWQW